MMAKRRYLTDVVSWEEALPYIVIVKSRDEEEVDVDPLPTPIKGILKPFDQRQLRYNVVSYDLDPDNRDRGRFRFPNLRVDMKRTTKRTASPPPRPDLDPDRIWEEAARRARNKRFRGPPIQRQGEPKEKAYTRVKNWEIELPESDERMESKRKREPEIERHRNEGKKMNKYSPSTPSTSNASTAPKANTAQGQSLGEPREGTREMTKRHQQKKFYKKRR